VTTIIAALALIGVAAAIGAFAFAHTDVAEPRPAPSTTPTTTSVPSTADSTTTSLADGAPDRDSLAGLRGVLPQAEVTAAFRDRMLGVDPAITEFMYGPETYDATIVAALGAIAAGTDGVASARRINDVTRGGEVCGDIVSCRAALAAGKDIDYDGESGRLDFAGNGEPTTADFFLLEVGPQSNSVTGEPCPRSDECIDHGRAALIEGELPATADVPTVPVDVERAGDGTFTVGVLLPITGSISYLGAGMTAAVQLAVDDVNASGGVGGRPVRIVVADSGDVESRLALTTAPQLLDLGADVVIGAASSYVTESVIDRITSAGVAMISPSNTSAALSAWPDHGLYFRTAPSDIMQAKVLADVVVGSGWRTAFAILRDDEYGNSLGRNFETSLTAAGGVLAGIAPYDPNRPDVEQTAAEAVDSGADGIILIGYEESSLVLRELIDRGIDPGHILCVDGNIGDDLVRAVEAGR